ncbi:MAG: hypothetical protein K0U64_03630 [Actinomycetia bacterium]|nr:hypothetical protein [Actinomycetes bacterium]
MTTGSGPLRILLYSDDVNTRNNVKQLLGLRPTMELPAVEYVEVATEPVVIREMDAGGIDLAILDGEAVPAGGMGITRQLKDEIYQCPPVLVLVARQSDAWLATWSRADAVAPTPLDPMAFPELVASLLRQRIGSLPTV